MQLLLEIVFDHLGWHHAELWTLAENERAIKSFEKVGFRRVGIEREVAYYEGKYHDVVLMEQQKLEEVVSFDRDFDRVNTVRRVEP